MTRDSCAHPNHFVSNENVVEPPNDSELYMELLDPAVK